MSATPLLLLDDDGEFRSVVADALQAAGFRLFEAATVAEAEAEVLRGATRFAAGQARPPCRPGCPPARAAAPP